MKKSLFDSFHEAPNEGTVGVLKSTRRWFSEHGNPFNALGEQNNIFSMEGLSDAEISHFRTAQEKIAVGLSNVIDEVGHRTRIDANGNITYDDKKDVYYTENQRKAAIMGAIAASSAGSLHRSLESQYQSLRRNPEAIGSNQQIIGSGNLDYGRLEEAVAAFESYDEQENRNTMMYTFAYNLAAARQNAFGEAFFKTVVLSPDVASVTISLDLLSVMEDYKRSVDGTFKFDFGRKSLVRAIIDHTILNKETNRIYPIFRDTSTESKSNFVDDSVITPWEVTLENDEVIKTSALKVGATFDLISLGTPDYLVADGPLDFTDQIEPGMRLSAAYLKLKNGDVIKYDNLEMLPEAQFVYQPQGRSQTMGLTFELASAAFTEHTKKIDGSAVTANAITTNKYRANLNISLYGSVNTDDGLTTVNAGKVTVNSIYDANNKKLDIKTGPGKTAADEFDGAEIIGYSLYANRINTNRRERGQIIDLNRHRQVYNIPILAPISIVRPTSEDDSSYSARLDSLVTTTHIGCSNAAVTTLLSAKEALRGLPPVMEPELIYASEVLGAARFYVTPYYNHVDIDVFDTVNTLSSANRIVDVNAVLINLIREEVFKAYLASNYQAARDVLKGDLGNKKPKVIIGTDPKTASYLQIIGDTRSLGDNFNFEIVNTPDLRVRDTIFIAFGDDGSGNSPNEVCNPLSFGSMFWRPEITSSLQISRRGQISKELTVQPSYRHIVHCPILVTIKVSNLSKAVTTMLPIKNKVIP